MMQHTKEYADTLDPTELRVKEFKAPALSAGFRNLLQRLEISEMREPYPIAIPRAVLGREHLHPPALLDLPHIDSSLWGIYINIVTDSTGEVVGIISAQASHTAPILESLPLDSTVEEQQEPSSLCQSVNNQCTAA